MWSIILSILLSLTGLFLMFIVLLQRGRGGGLAGAFGGLGGQSAFGTKAGDVFTRITIVVAAIWILLAGGTGIAMWQESEGRFPGGEDVETTLEAPDDETDETPAPPLESPNEPEAAGGPTPDDEAAPTAPEGSGGPEINPPRTGEPSDDEPGEE